MARRAILAIDEGTTNSKAILVAESGDIISSASAAVPIEHPKAGWVQQDANEIWTATRSAIANCLNAAADVGVAALGISNQRESILAWDRGTGEPLGPVITWQCRRTADACEELIRAGKEDDVIARTGLPLDPMFPPTKAAWLLNNADQRPDRICLGTVDSWLIWKLSGGVHATDRSNAARTQLFNLNAGQWDGRLCDLFGIPMGMLPDARDSSHVFGKTKGAEALPDGVPIASAIGDSHGALFGHGAFAPGDGKVTFGTGSSVMTTIAEFAEPPSGITTTIAWSLNGSSTFAFEGNILVSASILPWTAELLGLNGVDDLLELAKGVENSKDVCLVPAHVGLGSPHWDSRAQGLISGLSFGAKPAHIARAAADSIALQVLDIVEIMSEAAGGLGRLFVDGGPSGNAFLMQIVANLLNRPIEPGKDTELSALGAAYLAGLATGFWSGIDEVARLPSHRTAISPQFDASDRAATVGNWRNSIARATLRA